MTPAGLPAFQLTVPASGALPRRLGLSAAGLAGLLAPETDYRLQFQIRTSAAALASQWLVRAGADSLPVSAQITLGQWSQIRLGFRTGAVLPAEPVFDLFYLSDSSADGAQALIGAVQLEAGLSDSAPQQVESPEDIREPGVAERWFLQAGSDSALPVLLPAGACEIAWLTPAGEVGYHSLISSGSSPADLLRAPQIADVLVCAGSLSSAEKAALEHYWQSPP